MDHAYILGHGAVGTMTFFDYVPPIDERMSAGIVLDLGTEDDIASIPKSQVLRLREPFGLGRIPVAFGYQTHFMHVSPAMKETIETLEPGVHRFLPVKLESAVPIDGKLEHGTYYILLPPPLVDCIVIEHTRFAKGFGYEGWSRGLGGTGGGGLPLDRSGPCVLRKQSVLGRHLWRTKVGKFNYTMISDQLWQAIGNEPQSWGANVKCTLSSKYDAPIH